MYPIPDHLKSCFVPVGDDNSEMRVTGAIRCACGGLLFTPYINEAGTVAALRCPKCGEKLLLFHAARHGWDAFVAKADYLYDVSGKLHAYDACPQCQARTPFAIRATITSFGRQDFIDESELEDDSGKKLREEDWVNAFSSFRLDVVCPACAQTTQSVIDIETA